MVADLDCKAGELAEQVFVQLYASVDHMGSLEDASQCQRFGFKHGALHASGRRRHQAQVTAFHVFLLDLALLPTSSLCKRLHTANAISMS
jgi:hypothetical protein